MNATPLTEILDELEGLMREFGLTEATLRRDTVTATFRKSVPTPVAMVAGTGGEVAAPEEEVEEEPESSVAPPAPQGTPVTSPMNGIFYSSPSPGQPAFVKEGDTVTAGQTVGLIEAMKVFNEIPCPISGTVSRVVAKSGAVVNPGEPLIFVS